MLKGQDTKDVNRYLLCTNGLYLHTDQPPAAHWKLRRCIAGLRKLARNQSLTCQRNQHGNGEKTWRRLGLARLQLG